MNDDRRTLETRLRNKARRHGLVLRKLSRLDRYMLIDPDLQIAVCGHQPDPFSADLREIERFLEGHSPDN